MSIGYTSTDPSGGAGLPGPVGTVVYYVTGGVASLMIKWGTGNTNWATATPGLTSGGLTTTDPRGGAGLAGPITSQVYYVTGGVATLLVKWGLGDTNWALTAPAVPAGSVPTTRLISAGTGLTGGGDLSADRTLTLADTAVSPGSYTLSSITVDQQGRLTSASSGASPAPLIPFGDGSDGAVTFDGSATILGLAPSSSVYTMTRDLYLADTSAVNVGVTLKVGNGYRVYCRGNLVLNGIISSKGNPGSAGTNTAGGAPGLTVTGGFFRMGSSGGTGAGNGVGPAAGIGSTQGAPNFLCGNGGKGGDGLGTGAAGGVVSNGGDAAYGTINNAVAAERGGVQVSSGDWVQIGGGGGGGGGSFNAGNPGGGGGGAGGGYTFVASQTISGSGSINADGGIGGDASNNTNCGGGGGGGGGYCICVLGSGSYPTMTAAGGVGGVGHSGGANGTTGATGKVIKL